MPKALLDVQHERQNDMNLMSTVDVLLRTFIYTHVAQATNLFPPVGINAHLAQKSFLSPPVLGNRQTTTSA